MSTPVLRRVGMLLAMMLLVGVAQAQPRAWLDRDRIAFGDTTTLNVESEGAATPDWGPLQRDFELEGHTSRRQVEILNGRQSVRTLHGVALRPRREGLFEVPALEVDGAWTSPLQLTVEPAPVRAARDGGPVFVEADIDTQSPFVQQAVAYTLRLHYAVPLVSGQLEQPPPEGASLQRIGSDTQYTRDLAGRRYTVVERRFLLVPERSGPLTIPGARFEGRGASGGMFDGLFNRGPRALSANGPPSLLTVRPMPAGAGPAWLPVQDVQARWLETPTTARAGAAATLVLEVVFDGAVGTQLPDVPLPPIEGAQVFAEPPQYDETFDEGRPQVRLTRRYSIVPQAEGTLRIGGPRIDWWDVGAGTARTTQPPPVTLRVGPGAAMPGTRPASADAGAPIFADAAASGVWRGWPWVAAVLATLWVATAVFALQLLRQRRVAARGATGPAGSARPARVSTRQLLDLLRSGDPGQVEQALRGLVTPAAADLDALSARLADPAQRAALAAWQQARWGGGDPGQARQHLREAFRRGAQLSDTADGDPAILPPLYPGA